MINQIHPLETRLGSLIEAAKAKAAVEGRTGPTLEEKQIAVLGLMQSLTMLHYPARLPEDIREMLIATTSTLAPELYSKENAGKLRIVTDMFVADMSDLAAGKIQGFPGIDK